MIIALWFFHCILVRIPQHKVSEKHEGGRGKMGKLSNPTPPPNNISISSLHTGKNKTKQSERKARRGEGKDGQAFQPHPIT